MTSNVHGILQRPVDDWCEHSQLVGQPCQQCPGGIAAAPGIYGTSYPQADDPGPADNPTVEEAPAAHAGPRLVFEPIADLCARVDAAGPRRWLLQGIWPELAYGVMSGEMKAQKSWAALDMAISVASGTPWLGAIGTGEAAPVLTFSGEGGDAALVRRLRAICASRDLALEQLPLTTCLRSPHLADRFHYLELAAAIHELQPRLVILDPWYLSAPNANSGSLNEMGALLERAQHLCEQAGSALAIVAHHNRTQGKGAFRISGAGPAEWGRVIITTTVVARHSDPATRESTVITDLDIIGGEVPEQTMRVVRRVRSDDPDDMNAPLHYQVDVTTADELAGDALGMPPARAKLLAALEAIAPAEQPRTGPELVDWIASTYSHGLHRATWSRELGELVAMGLADEIDPGDGHGRAKRWFISSPVASEMRQNDRS